MKIGCHGSVWAGSFEEAGFRRAVEGTSAAGFDVIEIPLMDPYSFDIDAGRRILEGSGLQMTASLGLTEATDISSERPEAVAAGEALLQRALDVLAGCGGTHLAGVLYGAMKKHVRPATEAGIDNGRAVIGRLADRAADLGIVIGLEVVNRYETNVLNTAKQAVEYVAGLGRDNVVVHLDTYHMNIEESGMHDPVVLAGQRLGYVHIGESHRGYLGSGNVDFGSFFRGLAAVGYDGIMTFESFSSVVVDENLSGALGVWRNLWDDPADLASHAAAFMRAQARAVETIRFH